MGGGCSSTREDSVRSRERLISRRVGNFNFLQYGECHVETKRTGLGCRRTPAWDCTVTQEELIRKREEFWDTRVEGDLECWKLLRMACEAADSASAETIVHAGGLTLAQGTIQVCYDSTGRKYELPPYVINEPVCFRPPEENAVVAIPNETYHLTLRSTKAPDMSVIMNSLQQAVHLKEVFSAKTNIAIDKVRLFFNGKELKNNMPLGKAQLTNEVVVQVMVVG